MISSKVGHSLDPYLLKIYILVFGKKAVHPNVLTVAGACFGLFASAAIVFRHFLLGAVMLFLSGFLDMLDGALARSSKKVSVFGGFLDSVLDRYTDLLGCRCHSVFLHDGRSFLLRVHNISGDCGDRNYPLCAGKGRSSRCTMQSRSV